MNDIDNSIVAFEKSNELYSNNDLEREHPRNYLYQIFIFDFDLKSLSNHNEFVIKLDQITNNSDNKSLLLIRCKVNIELKKYEDAELDLNRLFELNNDISFVYSLQKYEYFWSYMCDLNYRYYRYIDHQLEINGKFNDYMYMVQKVYFMSNLFRNNDYQLQESNLNRYTLSFKNNLMLPALYHYDSYTIWKINIKKIFSSDCFIKFIVKYEHEYRKSTLNKEYTLKYENILKLEGLGWIEYLPTISQNIKYKWEDWMQLSIEKNSIDMDIEYVRFTDKHRENQIYFPEVDHCLSTNNVSKVENLLELKDIINNL